MPDKSEKKKERAQKAQVAWEQSIDRADKAALEHKNAIIAEHEAKKRLLGAGAAFAKAIRNSTLKH